MPVSLLKQFLRLESLSGIILFIAAIIAICWANSSFRYLYVAFTHNTFLFWINEGLMALFFLVVGLELKRSYLEGKFLSIQQIILPLVAAVGGMIVPVMIYIFFNYHDIETLKGWAIPVATDIAFALGVLSLFGTRVPIQLKLFLLALAIFDDIGAIIIIAIWFTHDISYVALMFSLFLLAILYLFNQLAIHRLSLYLLIGIALWYALLKTGVHPTIGGFLLALAIPYHDGESEKSPLHRLEEGLHPWVAYVIVPLFALANAGFSFARFSYEIMRSSIVLGTAIGLFIGKQIGVFGASWLFIRIKFAQLPENTTWLGLYGVALLCGIGFTMSLFLGTLSFQNESLHLAEVRLGVIIGTILSGILGALILTVAFANRTVEEDSVE